MLPTFSLVDLERYAIIGALATHHGNRTHAARELGISVRTLQRKLKADPAITSQRMTQINDEINECRQYHQPRIAELERLLLEAQNRNGDLAVIVGNIEQCRCQEGDSIMILCDNPEPESVDRQAAVEAIGDYTSYEPMRFYGRDWAEALRKAASAAQNHYMDSEDHA